MTDNELRLKRSIERIMEDSDDDKAERIMSLYDDRMLDIDEVIELCQCHATVETDIYIDEDAIKKRLGL